MCNTHLFLLRTFTVSYISFYTWKYKVTYPMLKCLKIFQLPDRMKKCYMLL